MHKANVSFFKDKKVVQLFDRYATYNGSNPYFAPATLNIIPHVEYNMGGYIVKEGIYTIPQKLTSLAEKLGVKFHFNCDVQRVLTDSKNNVTGIKVDDKKINFSRVISNVDVNYTYQILLNDKTSRQSIKYSKLEPSLSGIVFYWGVKGTHKNLEIHNILFSQNYKNEFEDIFDKKISPNDPTVYIYISSKFNKNHSPNETENWFVMVNSSYISNQNWGEEISKTRQRILKKINDFLGIDLNDKILFEKVLSPFEIEKQTNSYRGSIYGISSNNKYAAFLRHPNRSKKYKGLYFCGGSAHPGGGIPLVILSGKIAAESLIKDTI